MLIFGHIFILIFGKRKKWLISQIKEYEIPYNSLFCFVLLKKEDKEIFDLFFASDIYFFPNFYFDYNVGFEEMKLAFEKKIKTKAIWNIFLGSFVFFVENEKFDFDFVVNNKEIRITFKTKKERDVIVEKSFVFSSKNEEIKDFVNNFKFSDVKIGILAKENIFKEIKNKYLNGFDICFENYEMKIESRDSDNGIYSVLLINKESLRNIKINHVKIKENSGMVVFAGSGERPDLSF